MARCKNCGCYYDPVYCKTCEEKETPNFIENAIQNALRMSQFQNYWNTLIERAMSEINSGN